MIAEEKILPKNWKWEKLGDVANYLNGRGFKKTEWEDKGLPIIRIQNLNKEVSNYNYTTKSFEDRYKVKNGDLLFAWAASLGTYIWKGKEAWLNQHIFKVEPKEFCDKLFLFYSLEKIIIELYAKTHGSGMVHVTKGKFEATLIPLPPKPTQQAIVSKIEELFSELDKGIENLRLAQQQLKTYRQSVLKWAFEGKLTNENVKESELPHWKKVKLKEMSDSIQYGYTESSSKEPIGPKFLRITDIQENKVEWDEVPYCKIDKENISKYLLKEGDLVFARTGATVGKSFLIKGEIPEAIFASYLIRVRVNKEINEKYLSYFFHSPNYWSQITEGQVGIGQPNVNGTKLGQLDLVLAPIAEQNKIVQEIESRLSVADKMEESITQSLQQAEALRQSILKKAFEGKLM